MHPGSLLRLKAQCRSSRTAKENGEYALLVRRVPSRPDSGSRRSFGWDAYFPSTGRRILFVENNWEIISVGPELVSAAENNTWHDRGRETNKDKKVYT